MAEIEGTGCCAVEEMVDLQYDAGPVDTLIKFCAQLDDKDNYIDRYIPYYATPERRAEMEREIARQEAEMAKRPPSLAEIGAFYIFTGVEKVIKLPKNHPRYVSQPYKVKTKYGSKFAAYLKRHKLGTVVASAAKPNRVNHPDHIVKVWIWTPSEPNLLKWWKKHYQQPRAKEAVSDRW